MPTPQNPTDDHPGAKRERQDADRLALQAMLARSRQIAEHEARIRQATDELAEELVQDALTAMVAMRTTSQASGRG